jgi:hypothetical protein
MPTAHLTDIVVSRLKAPGTYFDETTPTFGMRVGKNRKTWIVMRGKIRQRIRIGHYPSPGVFPPTASGTSSPIMSGRFFRG